MFDIIILEDLLVIELEKDCPDIHRMRDLVAEINVLHAQHNTPRITSSLTEYMATE